MSASTALQARMLGATRPDPFAIPRVTVAVREMDAARFAILTQDAPLTAAQWAFVEAGTVEAAWLAFGESGK